MDRLKGRVAIITGAGGAGMGAAGGDGGGMGRAMALAMAREGARIVAVDINRGAADRTIAEVARLGSEGVVECVDVADGEGMRAAIERAVQRFGRLDILCNHVAAGGPEIGNRDIDVVSTPIEVYDRTMAVNLRGPFLACKYAIPHMLRTTGQGCIINTSSGSGFLGDVNHVAYAASKAGLQGLTRAIATSHGKRGIRCNTIATGLVLSPAAEARFPKPMLEVYEANRLVKPVGRPEQMAALAVFLASDDGAYVTGQTILMDGGHTAHQPWYSMARTVHPEAFKDDAGG